MSNDGASSFLALAARFARLDVTGAPIVGANAVYVTKLVQATISPELHTGKDIEKEAGDGTLCLTAKLPDFQKRKNVTLNFCADDPELTWLLVGGSLLKTNALAAPVVTATPSSTGGSLTAAHGPYGYRVSTVDANGETLPSAEVTATIATGSAGSVGLAWSAVTGAVSYHVYGRTVGGELLLANVTSPSYTDTGAATPAGALPTSNTTGVTVGWEEPPAGSPGRPYGVSVELWTYAWLGGAQASNTGSPPPGGGGYKRHVLSKAVLTLGERQFGPDASDFTVTGFAIENPGIGTGPGHDLLGSGGMYWTQRDTTFPTPAVGLQAGT